MEDLSWKERRRHRRINTKLRGRYMLADRREFACTVIDVALGGVAVAGPERGAIGEPVIVYIDQLGRVEGNIVRHLPNGFAVQLTITTRATEKFAHRLQALVPNGKLESLPDRRREPRIPIDNGKVASLASSVGAECEVIDLSVSGADLKIRERPPVGALVQLGQLRGRVVRHSRSGVAIEFVDVSVATTLTDRLAEVVVKGNRGNGS